MKRFFDFQHFRYDLLGGITAGIVALPLLVSAALIAGITYSTVFIVLSVTAGCGGLLMLMAPPVRPEAV